MKAMAPLLGILLFWAGMLAGRLRQGAEPGETRAAIKARSGDLVTSGASTGSFINSMKIGLIFLFALCGMASQRLIAQDRGGSCCLNDSECLEVEVMRKCGDPSTSTAQACSAWIRSIQDRAGTSDTVAKRHIAEAYSAISQHPATSTEDRSLHRTAAREIYAPLVEQDERDVRALRGMAALSRNLGERIDALRKIVAIVPQAFDAELLAEALAQRGSDGDLSEAAQVLESAYRMFAEGCRLGFGGASSGLLRAGGKSGARAIYQGMSAG